MWWSATTVLRRILWSEVRGYPLIRSSNLVFRAGSRSTLKFAKLVGEAMFHRTSIRESGFKNSAVLGDLSSFPCFHGLRLTCVTFELGEVWGGR